MCQALGLHPTSKYESDGGPGIARIVELIRDQSNEPNEDVGAFMDAIAFNWLIAGTDAHAKNYSLLIGFWGWSTPCTNLRSCQHPSVSRRRSAESEARDEDWRRVSLEQYCIAALARCSVAGDPFTKELIGPSAGSGCEIWSTDQMPIDNSAAAEAAQRAGFVKHTNYVGDGGGTTFRINEWTPGHARFTHRTETMDYAIVLSGEIDCELENGEVVHLKSGDVMIQRGTIPPGSNTGSFRRSALSS